MKIEFDTLGELITSMDICPICKSKNKISSSLLLSLSYDRGYEVELKHDYLEFTITAVHLPKTTIKIHSDNRITVCGKNSDYTIERCIRTNSYLYASIYSYCHNKCYSSNSEDIKVDLENMTATNFKIQNYIAELYDDECRYLIDCYYDDDEMYISRNDKNPPFWQNSSALISMPPTEFDFSDIKKTINKIQAYLLLG